MSSPKERHYWAQLRAALTAGQWRTPNPGKTPKGGPLPWSELLRKFNKHCRGYREVSEVAAQTQALALLLSARYEDDDEDIEVPMSGSEKDLREPEELNVDGECVLPEERIEEALVGYQILQGATTSNFDTIYLALAYYAFALRRPSECLSHLQKVSGLLQFQNFIPTSPDSARTSLVVPSTYAPSTASFTGSFASASNVDAIMPEIRDGRVWAITEAFRSLCLQGMSQELLHPSDPSKAIIAYRQALPLLDTLQLELGLTSNASAPNSGKTPYRSATQELFNQTRELWRWVERLLWRAVILSAKTSDVHVVTESATQDSVSCPPFESRTSSTSTVTPTNTTTMNNSLWTWLSHYSACSTFWPPRFRAKHHSTVSVIHLRAFILRFGGPSSPPSSLTPPPSDTTSRRPSTSSATGLQQQQSWRTEALVVVKAYRTVLTASTYFPKAGERNFKVEEFVEICVALWEAGWVVRYGKGENGWESVGEDLGASWVIDILQWSQTLTFNSSLILRHMTKLLHLSATSALSPAPYNRMLAKRTLKLYMQVVSKAWEASKEGVGEDMDSDSRWVETLIFGARMLASETARHFREGGVSEPHLTIISPRGDAAATSGFSSYFAGHATAGAAQGHYSARAHAPLEDDETQIEDVREAARVLEMGRLRLDESDTRLLAEVLLTEGVVWGLLGVITHDSLKRPAQLQTAHAALMRSIHINPTPSAYYHLALSFARRIPSSALVPPTVIHNSDPAPEGMQTIDPYAHVHSLPRALECAGYAVEGQPADVRYWHLLGLLLSAQENWAGAQEILERGAALDFVNADEERNAAETQQASSDGAEEEDGDSEEEDETTGSGDAFLLLSPNGADRNGESVNGERSTSKRKRSPTITANGYLAADTRPSTPAKLTALDPTAASLPPASSILKYLHPTSPAQRSEAYALTFDQYPPAPTVLFERHLQLRMTRVALMEVMDGPEGAEEGWLEVFAWIAEKHRELRNSVATNVGEKKDATPIPPPAPVGADASQPQEKIAKMRMYQGLSTSAANVNSNPNPDTMAASWNGTARHQSLEVPIGITISPATPEVDVHEEIRRAEETLVVHNIYDEKDESGTGGRGVDGQDLQSNQAHEKRKTSSLQEKKSLNNHNGLHPKVKRSMSSERGGDTSKSKKMQQMLKNRVHKSRAGITAVSRKIGHGVVRNTGGLRRSTSTPDFHAALQPTSYQASSIHSRRRLSSLIHSSDEHERGITDTRTATPIQGEWPNTAPSATPPSTTSSHRDCGTSQTSTAVSTGGSVTRNAREDRLMSDLWLMSAATFRRLGKIEHAKGAIQEAELRDETNPNVWVQLGLYYVALRLYQQAVDSFQKARFNSPDDVPATVHLSRLFLDPEVTVKLLNSSTKNSATPAQVPLASSPSSSSLSHEPPMCTPTSTPDTDLATGMLARLAKARGWDVPEVWYFLSKAYALQERREMEREALKTALELSEGRGVRDIGRSLGWCL